MARIRSAQSLISLCLRRLTSAATGRTSAGQLTVAAGTGPVEAGTEVGPQLGEAGDTFDLGRADEQLVDVGDLVEAPLRVAPGDQVAGAVILEMLGCELAHGLQQSETPAERAGLDDEHRPLDQVPQQVIDPGDVGLRIVGNAPGRRDVKGPGEDGEPLEEHLLGSREQVVGPLDGCPQRPVALRAGSAAAGQKPKPIAESFHEIRWCETSRASGSQLDGERYAIEATANLLDVVSVGVRIERR